MGSPFRVESVSILDRNEVSSSTFLVFGWGLSDGVTLSGRGCPDLDLNEDSLRTFPSGWCLAFAMGHPFRVGWRLFAHSIGTKASSVHLSLVASRWGHPAGRVRFFAHSIVTKPTLVSCSVFLQDGIPLSGLDLLI